LLVVCVLGIPTSTAVLTDVFPDLEPMVESLELSRLVLADQVPGNGESWFIARALADAAEASVRGVVAFADPVPRDLGGRTVFPGHRGVIHIASNALYSAGPPHARSPCPDGRVLSDQSAQKIRKQERGHAHAERQLVRLGATPRRAGEGAAAWLADALSQLGATRLRHRGNHRYAFRLGATARRRALIRVGRPASGYPAGLDTAPAHQLDIFDAAAGAPSHIAEVA